MTKMNKGNALFLSLVAGLGWVVSGEVLAFEKYSQDADINVLNPQITAESFNRRWGPHNPALVAFENLVAKRFVHAPKETEKNIIKDVNQSDKKASFSASLESGIHVPTTGECGPSPLSPSQIEALVRATARKYEVDEDLSVGIAWAESRFDRLRNSPAGARGPMQLMPETAARFGVRDICEPEQNIEGGVKYLRLLLNEFKNPLLAIAAYNSGEGRIYEYGGIPPFPETVGYVTEVTNHELGVTLPARKPTQIAKQATGPIEPARDTGVIPVQKNGKFVAGTMHF